MSQVYCTAPFNGLTIREDGHVRTCCTGEVSLGNLNSQTIEDIQHSSTLRQIRESMLNNNAHENCEFCVYQEQTSGLASLREHYLKFYPKYDTFRLKNIDVRWNNTCNLSCMYCTPEFSSTWAEKLNTSNYSPVKNYQDDLLSFILTHVDDIDEITLVGGEPMLMKQNYELIAKLPDSSRVSIITNLSYDLARLPCTPNLLKRPKENTVWNISCENVDQQFEYVRTGGQWQQMETNLKFLVQHWPDQVVINMVYSMFSAFDIVETVERFYQIGIKKFNFQTYYGPSAVDVFAMPTAVQSLAGQQLDTVIKTHYKNIHPEDHDFYPLANLNLIKTKLAQAQGDACSRKEFYEQIAWYDQWSTLKFKDHWPHVIDLVELHLE